MAAAETQHPRSYINTAFKTIYWRFGVFFILEALAVGIVIPYNDPMLKAAVTGASPSGGTAAASPYVIAMTNLQISGLPHLVNVLLVTTIFSAGNTYTFAANRVLHGMALDGRAPRCLSRCTKQGVPWAAFLIVMCFLCLSFLSVSSGSKKVLTWLVNLITASGAINYLVITTTYIFFYKACLAQSIDRRGFPYVVRFQPYSAYIEVGWMVSIVSFYGYSAFTPWSVELFFTYYSMQLAMPALWLGRKLIRHTKLVKPHEADLVWARFEVEAYESPLEARPVSFWCDVAGMLGRKRRVESLMG